MRVFPPAIPLAAIALGILLQLVFPIEPGFAIPAPDRWWLGAGVVLGAVVGLGAYPALLQRRAGQTENPWTPTHEIVQRGPYRFTRNPMYLQMVLVCVGVALALWNPWILGLAPVAAALLHHFAIRPEEEYLERKFGDAYRDYKRRVRRWL